MVVYAFYLEVDDLSGHGGHCRLLDVAKRSAEWRGEAKPMELVFPPAHLCTGQSILILCIHRFRSDRVTY